MRSRSRSAIRPAPIRRSVPPRGEIPGPSPPPAHRRRKRFATAEVTPVIRQPCVRARGATGPRSRRREPSSGPWTHRPAVENLRKTRGQSAENVAYRPLSTAGYGPMPSPSRVGRPERSRPSCGCRRARRGPSARKSDISNRRPTRATNRPRVRECRRMPGLGVPTPEPPRRLEALRRHRRGSDVADGETGAPAGASRPIGGAPASGESLAVA